jgi:CRP-like cAMP-binding protein
MNIAFDVCLTASKPQLSPANLLLATMSAADRASLAAAMVEVELVRGVDLVLPEQPIVNCWFPLSGMISVITMTPSGMQTEVGVTGREGFVDLATLHGGDRSPLRALVQIPGRAFCLKASGLRAAMHASPTLNALLLAYAQAFSVQVAGTALANAQFTIQQRLARWLLMCADRVGPTGIALTHESLSIMLGVRRAGVTIALNRLQLLGAIATRRAGIAILDRDLLLGIAKESYGTPEAEYRRLIEDQLQREAAT